MGPRVHFPELLRVFSEPDFPSAHCLHQDSPLPRCSRKASPHPGAEPLNPVPGPLEAPQGRRCCFYLLCRAQGPFMLLCTPPPIAGSTISSPSRGVLPRAPCLHSTQIDTQLKEDSARVCCMLARYKEACRVCSSVPIKWGQTVSKWPEDCQVPSYKLDLWRGPSRSCR